MGGILKSYNTNTRIYNTNLVSLGDVKKIVLCVFNIEKEPFLKEKKLPLTIDKEYNVYCQFEFGVNHPDKLPQYLIMPDDKYNTRFLRFIKKIFFIKNTTPLIISSKYFKDLDTQYLRNKKLGELLA